MADDYTREVQGERPTLAICERNCYGICAMTDAPTMIQAEKLSKVYGSFQALKDVSFSVPRGQVAAFLGPNGAGKTTTMKILTGFLSPSSGIARIAGYDVAVDRLAAAEKLGYL